jgi:hypothetical protein
MAFELKVIDTDSNQPKPSLGIFNRWQDAFHALVRLRDQGQLAAAHFVDIDENGLYYRVNEVLNVSHLRLEMYHDNKIRIYLQYVEIR